MQEAALCKAKYAEAGLIYSELANFGTAGQFPKCNIVDLRLFLPIGALLHKLLFEMGKSSVQVKQKGKKPFREKITVSYPSAGHEVVSL